MTIVFTDLDETFLNDKGNISAVDIQTVCDLREKNVAIGLSTGRNFSGIRDILGTLQKEGGQTPYLILGNGALIYDNHGKLIDERPLNFKDASKIFQHARSEKSFCTHIYTPHHVFINRLNSREREFLDQRRISYVEVDFSDLSMLKDSKILKIMVQSDDVALRKHFFNYMQNFSEGWQVSFSSNRYVEINRDDVSKGLALRRLAKFLKLRLSKIIAIGDNGNDLSMMNSGAYGVAVSNAIPEVKKYANHVLAVDNNHGPLHSVFRNVIMDKSSSFHASDAEICKYESS